LENSSIDDYFAISQAPVTDIISKGNVIRT